MGRVLRRLAAAAVLVVLLVEVALRAGSSRLPEPVTWYHPVAQVKVEQMARLASEGTVVDVALVGTSQMAQGVDPIRFRDLAAGRPVTYNAAIVAGYPLVNRRFVGEEVVPRLAPRTVVYGVSYLDWSAGDDPPYASARATSTTVWGSLDRWASEWSYLVRYRNDLRNPSGWRAVVSGTSHGRVEQARSRLVGEWGSWRAYLDGPCAAPTDADLQTFARAGGGDAFVPDAERVDAFWQTVEALRGRGTRVVVAVMPFPDCHFARDPGARGANDGFRRALAEQAAGRRVEVVDVSGEVTRDEWFSDQGHLDRVGAERFTALLAARVVIAR